jgi:hypothetical protein
MLVHTAGQISIRAGYGRRRIVISQHHHVSPQYLYQYANEAAWKEGDRRFSNGELSYWKLALALAHPVGRVWSGCWQRSAA